MKITGIEIGEYRQFKNIKFDFTYPADHAKAGQPLEKVCFIGQSGTGKTTLLNVIWDFFEVVNDGYRLNAPGFTNPIPSISHYNTFKSSITVHANINDHQVVFSDKSLLNDMPVGTSSAQWVSGNDIYEDIKYYNKFCLFIDESAVDHARSLTIDRTLKDSNNRIYIASAGETAKEDKKREEVLFEIASSKTLKLGFIDTNYLWDHLLSDVDTYDEGLRKIAIDLTHSKVNFSANRLVETLNKWQIDNPNPKIGVANECLNPILKKFFLEVDIEGTKAPIVLRTKGGTQLVYNVLSTGTKQILTTAIPVFKSQIGSGVVLFDEPERSLFPDIQRGLIEYYTSLAPEAQFFFATHSPIIASAFEPCERFILYFDENGEVNFHNGVAPEGDDPNDILRQDFDMAELMLEKGLKEYERYRHLAMQIRSETDEEKKNQLIVERLELGNRYNFAGQHAQNK